MPVIKECSDCTNVVLVEGIIMGIGHDCVCERERERERVALLFVLVVLSERLQLLSPALQSHTLIKVQHVQCM